jgi:hypothetical protein
MGVELWAKPYGDKFEVLLGTFWGTTLELEEVFGNLMGTYGNKEKTKKNPLSRNNLC